MDTQIQDLNTPFPSPDIAPITTEETLSVDPTVNYTPDTLSVDPVTAQLMAPLSPKVADPRSFKAFYGLGDILQKSREDIYGDLINGNEDGLRKQASAELDIRKEQATQNAIAEFAKRKGGALSIQDQDFISNAVKSLDAKTNPDSVFETAYAREYFNSMDRTADRYPSNLLNKAKDEIPTEAELIRQTGEDVLAKREFNLKLAEDADEAASKQSWTGWGVDFLKSLIPGYQDYILRGNNPNIGKFAAGGGLGSNLEAQAIDLLKEPDFDKYKQRVTDIYNNLYKSNPGVAAQFAHAMVGMSTSDVYLQNVLPLADYATIGSLAKAGVKAIFGAGTKAAVKDDLVKATRTMLKRVEDSNPSNAQILAATGDTKEAGIAKFVAQKVSDVPETQKALEALPSDLRIDQQARAENPGNFGRENVNRLNEATENKIATFADMVANAQKVNRTPLVLTSETVARAIDADMEDKLGGLRNRLFDFEPDIIHEPASNTYFKYARIGDRDGKLFMDRNVAENFAKEQGWGDLEVGQTELPKLIGVPEAWQKSTLGQQGIGYFIRKPMYVDEVSGRLRDALEAETAQGGITKSPMSFINSWLGKWRTPNETLSKAQIQNRLTTTTAPSQYIGFLQNNAAEIKALIGWKNIKNSQRWKDFSSVVEWAARDLRDDEGRLGRTFRSPQELEEAYQTHIKRLPDAQEVRAYFAFTDSLEFDRAFRNIAEHRNQLRVGAETHQFFTKGADGSRIGSGEFSGVVRNNIPGGRSNILIMGNKLGDEQLVDVSRLTTKLKEEYNKGLNDGLYKLIEVYAPERKEFSNFGQVIGDRRVRYVLAHNSDVETKPLTWDHVPRRGGGHIVYDYDHYLKQADVQLEHVGSVTHAIYNGDKTIAAVGVRKMGENFAKHLNQVREMLREGNEKLAEEYSNKNLHISWDQVNGWFNETRDEAGHIRQPYLNKEEPIHVVPKGKQINDLDASLEQRYKAQYGNFIDGTREGSLARQFQVEFTNERDAEGMIALTDKGTRYNPLYAMEPAEIVDPISMMNRALTRVINTNYFDDYKLFSVEHWLAEARQWLKEPDEARYSPIWHFNNPEYRTGIPEDIRRNLENQRMNIQSLLSVPSRTDAFLNSMAQKLMDASYTRFGPKGVLLDPKWVLPILRDPFRFIRSIVFHTTLGLFNPAQFLVQAMNHVNIMGIAGPKYATAGTYASQLHFFSTVNSHPNILAHLDNLASKLNLPGVAAWRPGEFAEAMQEGKRTGWFNVGREFATLDDIYANKVISNKGKEFLDAGGIFFRGGEQNARYSAWYTAYKEWRDANPTKVITQAERAAILERADLLNINMTRASSSMLHKGALSIPAQFYAYQLRLTELMLGSRLTIPERIRLFTANAAAFGIPVGTGVFGLPFADRIRQYALENNYVVGDNFLESLAMDGIPATLIGLTTGAHLNIGDRYGSNGLNPLRDSVRTDKTMWDIVGGAAFSKMKSIYESSDGMWNAMMSAFRGDNKYFPLTAEDFVAPFREISSLNSAWRLYAAINTGKWASKNETYLTDVSPIQAIIQSGTGLQSQEVADITRMTSSMREQKDYQDYIKKKFVQEYHRFLQAHIDNNPDQAKQFMTRGLAWLEIGAYPRDKWMDVISEAAKGNESLVKKVDWDFYLKNAPDDKAVARQRAFVTKQKISESNK